MGDPQDSYNTGLSQFLDKKSYKPTFEPFALKKSRKAAGKKKSSARKKGAKKR